MEFLLIDAKFNPIWLLCYQHLKWKGNHCCFVFVTNCSHVIISIIFGVPLLLGLPNERWMLIIMHFVWFDCFGLFRQICFGVPFDTWTSYVRPLHAKPGLVLQHFELWRWCLPSHQEHAAWWGWFANGFEGTVVGLSWVFYIIIFIVWCSMFWTFFGELQDWIKHHWQDAKDLLAKLQAAKSSSSANPLQKKVKVEPGTTASCLHATILNIYIHMHIYVWWHTKMYMCYRSILKYGSKASYINNVIQSYPTQAMASPTSPAPSAIACAETLPAESWWQLQYSMRYMNIT